MFLWLGLVLVIVGVAHLDDRDPGNVQQGWAALVVGVIALVHYLILEYIDRNRKGSNESDCL